MRNPATVFLMYHELGLPKRKLSQTAPRYKRYVIPLEQFEAQLTTIRDAGMHGVSVSEGLIFSPNSVAVTFDDGCETDFAAAPVLSKFGFSATFYVIAGFVGRLFYMNAAQLRELSGAGFEIGCHSMTHISMAGLDDASLRSEIAESKSVLEEMLGKTVQHFSCPGGEYDARTIDFARNAGYRSMAGSAPRANFAGSDVFQLGRVPVKRELGQEEYLHLCRGQGLGRRALQFNLQQGARRALGNRSYYRLRAAILGKSACQAPGISCDALRSV